MHSSPWLAIYTDVDGERKYMPQYFKFNAANPLAVRTKVRSVGESTLLEACIENSTRAPLLLNSVTFGPSSHLHCVSLTPPVASGAGVVFPRAGEAMNGVDAGGEVSRRGAPDVSGSGVGLPSLTGRALHLLAPSGGATHFLFELRPKVGKVDIAGPPIEGGNTLGKLEICWKGNMGEAGRLQTQQILGAPNTRKEVEVLISPVPPTSAKVAAPLSLECIVRNRSRKRTPPLELVIQLPTPTTAGGVGTTSTGGIGGPGAGAAANVRDAGGMVVGSGMGLTPGLLVDGPQRVSLGSVAAGEEVRTRITCVPLLPGVQRLPLLAVQEDPRHPEGQAARVLDQLQGLEVLVDR